MPSLYIVSDLDYMRVSLHFLFYFFGFVGVAIS
jgi:hypothetical protein